MKSAARKIASALMAVSMVFVLFGCGNSGAGDKEKFIGTWNAKVDMTELFNDNFQQGMGESGVDLADYFNIDRFELTMIFTFNEDGTYSIVVDEGLLSNTFENVKSDLKDGMTSYFEDMIAAEGVDMSLDEMLDYLGTTLDELIDESIGDDLYDEIAEEFAVSGKWDAANGKLYMTESVSEDIDKNTYDLYEITSGGIKLSEPEGVEDDMGIFPLLLTKIG